MRQSTAMNAPDAGTPNHTFTFPATPATYRYISAHRIMGLSALPENKPAEVTPDVPNARVFFTTDPDDVLAAVDRDTARRSLGLKYVFTGGALPSLDEEAANIAKTRNER